MKKIILAAALLVAGSLASADEICGTVSIVCGRTASSCHALLAPNVFCPNSASSPDSASACAAQASRLVLRPLNQELATEISLLVQQRGQNTPICAYGEPTGRLLTIWGVRAN